MHTHCLISVLFNYRFVFPSLHCYIYRSLGIKNLLHVLLSYLFNSLSILCFYPSHDLYQLFEQDSLCLLYMVFKTYSYKDTAWKVSVFSHISLIWSSFFNFQSVICSSSRKGNGWLGLRATYLSLCVTRIWQFFHRLKYHYLLFTWSVDVLPKYVRNFHVDWIFKSLFYFIRQ